MSCATEKPQRATNVSSMGASSNKKKSASLPPETVEYLKAWMMSPEHIAHPYPTEEEKAKIMSDTGIEAKQLTNWFVNNRKRYWKPRVEARLREQAMASQAVKGSMASPIERRVLTARSISSDCMDQESGKNLASSPSIGTRITDRSGRTSDDEVGMTSSTSFSSLSMPSSPVRTSASSTRPATVSPSRTVSDQSEVGSVGSQDSSSEDSNTSTRNDPHTTDDHVGYSIQYEEEAVPLVVKKTETVHVYITGRKVEDVVVVSDSAPCPDSASVLEQYKDCEITYEFPEKNEKVLAERRDAEIARLKKKYLHQFLSSTKGTRIGVAGENGKVRLAKRRRQDDAQIESGNEEFDETITTCLPPRPKYRRISIELWKDACLNASSSYDHDLPSLDEAAQLFGYTK